MHLLAFKYYYSLGHKLTICTVHVFHPTLQSFSISANILMLLAPAFDFHTTVHKSECVHKHVSLVLFAFDGYLCQP